MPPQKHFTHLSLSLQHTTSHRSSSTHSRDCSRSTTHTSYKPERPPPLLNVTQYAVQVNRHSINVLMNKVDETSHDVNNLYNLTTSLATSISFHQLIFHIRSVLANLHDSLSYIRMVSTHAMDYIDAATSGTLSPHILPIWTYRRC